MRVDVGVSPWRTKRGSKGSCCFFRGARGPLNPSLYSAAAMLPKATPSQCSFYPDEGTYMSSQGQISGAVGCSLPSLRSMCGVLLGKNCESREVISKLTN